MKKKLGFFIVLVVLNALAYLWSQGHFDDWVLNAGQMHNPARMTQEILPNSVQITNP